ncbi:alpha/beta fold hydrolase [Streptomyces sp. NPDC053427]|uniref:alpha/beta fold hydrolase n=1 Tax=Streptomyces sp. NPDC053427 TaxID=3365701 RepID=UPI0037D204E8
MLVLPGGFIRSRGRYWRFVEIELRNLFPLLTGEGDGPAVHLLRYRCRGWNGRRADTAVDARWALEMIGELHGEVPIAVVGNSLGGRAAFRVAGHPRVTTVVGVAPWLPDQEEVEHLAGRRVLMVHGERDRSGASARRSLAYARRARSVVPDLARLEAPGEGRYLLRRSADVWATTACFVHDALGIAAPPPPLAEALKRARDGDLRTPLPSLRPAGT